MSEFQTLMALVVLIFVLSVIVQAVQEVVKSLLNTKAETMKKTIQQFMGEHLTLQQVQAALQVRGLDITALENFNKDDFKHLLDGITLAVPQAQGIVANANATIDEVKNNIAGAYEGSRATFQKAYAAKNKTFAVIISFVVVVVLNSNLIMLYDEVATDQVVAQAIVGKATPGQCGQGSQPNSQSDLGTTYSDARNCIKGKLNDYPILMRSSAKQWSSDWSDSKLNTILGLFLMVILVSLGAPFWNDVLKGMTGVNNVLNTGSKQNS